MQNSNGYPVCVPGPANCTGSWGMCSEACIRLFAVATPATGGGVHCEAEDLQRELCAPGEGACPEGERLQLCGLVEEVVEPVVVEVEVTVELVVDDVLEEVVVVVVETIQLVSPWAMVTICMGAKAPRYVNETGVLDWLMSNSMPAMSLSRFSVWLPLG